MSHQDEERYQLYAREKYGPLHEEVIDQATVVLEQMLQINKEVFREAAEEFVKILGKYKNNPTIKSETYAALIDLLYRLIIKTL